MESNKVEKKEAEKEAVKDPRPSFSSRYSFPVQARKMRTVYPKKRFGYDKDHRVVVVDDGFFDVYAETQSHAREVGFDNIIHRLPDGQIVVSAQTSSGQGYYLDTTGVSDEPNQAIKDIDRMSSEKKRLDDTYGVHDWNKITGQELADLVNGYLDKKNKAAQPAGDKESE